MTGSDRWSAGAAGPGDVSRAVVNVEGHDGQPGGRPAGGQHLVELPAAALAGDDDLPLPDVPHHQAGDPGVAAEQRVAAPDRGGERLRQLPLTVPPASQLVLVGVLERHRGDAARGAATTRETNQRRRRAPARELLPHVLVSEQLAAPVVQPRGVRLAGLPAGRRPAQLAGLRLARTGTSGVASRVRRAAPAEGLPP